MGSQSDPILLHSESTIHVNSALLRVSVSGLCCSRARRQTCQYNTGTSLSPGSVAFDSFRRRSTCAHTNTNTRTRVHAPVCTHQDAGAGERANARRRRRRDAHEAHAKAHAEQTHAKAHAQQTHAGAGGPHTHTRRTHSKRTPAQGARVQHTHTKMDTGRPQRRKAGGARTPSACTRGAHAPAAALAHVVTRLPAAHVRASARTRTRARTPTCSAPTHGLRHTRTTTGSGQYALAHPRAHTHKHGLRHTPNHARSTSPPSPTHNAPWHTYHAEPLPATPTHAHEHTRRVRQVLDRSAADRDRR